MFASDFEGDRERPAANIALQWAPNDTSEYTFEAFYQGYREKMFNNLHFTFADWWGALGPNPASTITMYPDTNIIKTRVVGSPFGFNSGDSTEQSTDTLVYALNGKWEIGDRFTLEADLSIQDSEFDTQFIAVRTERVPAQHHASTSMPADGIPSWHFTNAATARPGSAAERSRRSGTWGSCSRTPARISAVPRPSSVDGDYDLGDDESIFKMLSFGVRFDDRDAVHRQPVTDSGALPARRPATFATMPEGMRLDQRRLLRRRRRSSHAPGWWPMATTSRITPMKCARCMARRRGARRWFGRMKSKERTQSAYVQLDMQFGEKFQAQVGVRYSKVTTPIEFNEPGPGGTA